MTTPTPTPTPTEWLKEKGFTRIDGGWWHHGKRVGVGDELAQDAPAFWRFVEILKGYGK